MRDPDIREVDEQICRAGLLDAVRELDETVQRSAEEGQAYLRYVNIALFEIKQRILFGSLLTTLLLSLILWRVW